LFFDSPRDSSADGGENNTNKNIKQQNGGIEDASIGKPALLEENQWKASSRNIVGAEICPEYGWQAAVREKMRGKDVDQDKDKESDQKSFEKSSRGCHIKIISSFNIYTSFW